MNQLISQTVQSPIGELLAVASDKGICMLAFMQVKNRLAKQIRQLEQKQCAEIAPGSSPFLVQLELELAEYFSGKRQQFRLALDFHGTDFQQHSWRALLDIPYGETRSYQTQAEAIHKPRAVRAVANANHCNRLPILIPCHRVIGKDGSLAGYGGEIWRKAFLLDLEAAYA